MRHNNFDALRLVAASAVVFSHAFLIAEGSEAHEPLIWLTGRQCILGLVGVFVFFTISGFLVTESYERTGEPLRYLAKRALRIFPGLFVALTLSAFVLAPMVTTLPLVEYLRRTEPYGYVVGNTMLNLTVHELPGVLLVNNPVGLEINGSLWTLRYEFMMYLLVLVLGVLRLLDWRVLLALFLFGLACQHWEALGIFGTWGWLLAFFVAGMLLYKLRDTRLFDGRIALLAALGLVASVPLREFIQLFALFGGYLTIYLALNPRLPALRATRFGDLSYGLYVYGWPVEMAVIYASGGHLAWWQLFLIAWPLAAGVAWLSWRYVEEPMLRLKPDRIGAVAAARLSATAAPLSGLRSPHPLP